MQDDSANVNRGPRPAPWSSTEIGLSVFLAWLFWPAAAYAVVKGLGVEHWYYPADTLEITRRLSLWAAALAAPFQVLTYPLIFSAYSRTTLEELGLTTRRFGRNVVAGAAALVLLAPAVFGIWALVRILSEGAGEHAIEPHALEIVARQNLYPGEWGLLFFTAMLGAPLHEELAFRGVLQPWLAARRWGGHVAMLGAFVLALTFRSERLLAAYSAGISSPQGIASLADTLTPALFVLALLPLYLTIWATSRTPLDPALFGTSLLFAYIHMAVWPTPMPLLVLALGLGELARRTRSLVGPIVLHGLFNGISCVQLLLQK